MAPKPCQSVNDTGSRRSAAPDEGEVDGERYATIRDRISCPDALADATSGAQKRQPVNGTDRTRLVGVTAPVSRVTGETEARRCCVVRHQDHSEVRDWVKRDPDYASGVLELLDLGKEAVRSWFGFDRKSIRKLPMPLGGEAGLESRSRNWVSFWPRQ